MQKAEAVMRRNLEAEESRKKAAITYDDALARVTKCVHKEMGVWLQPEENVLMMGMDSLGVPTQWLGPWSSLAL